MFKVLRARLKQGYHTIKFPDGPPPPMPDRFRGRPLFDSGRCSSKCNVCIEACPTGAISRTPAQAPAIDLAKCLFCNDCVEACPQNAIRHSSDYRLAVRKREDMQLQAEEKLLLAEALGDDLRKLLGRALRLRQVSAGGCNACEADTNVLTTIGWDLSRFGIQFVASPRHADGVLITGPVTANMQTALMETYKAVPAPKIVIAVGACALSGGIFAGQAEAGTGADEHLPVDLYIPGCPPHPLTILDGLLRILGRV